MKRLSAFRLKNLIFNHIEQHAIDNDILRPMDGLSAFCSDQTGRQTYFQCVNEVVRDCPFQGGYILDITNEHYSVLCEGNQAAEWLREKLVRELSVSQSECRYRHEEMSSCSEQMAMKYNMDGITVGAAASILPSFLTDVFHCSMTEIQKVPFSECNVSWKDMRVYTWLVFIVERPPLINLPGNCIAELMS